MLITERAIAAADARESALPGIITTFPDADDSPARRVNAIVPLLPASGLMYSPCHSPTSGFRSKSLETSPFPAAASRSRSLKTAMPAMARTSEEAIHGLLDI